MTNKELIINMYSEIFDRHDFSRINDYMHDDYIQHNPRVQTGLNGFVSYFRDRHFIKFPNFKINIKHIVSEGDMVAVHAHAQAMPGDDGTAVADIYRVQDGKLIEHWDVLQPVPKDFVHRNGMF